MNVTAENRDDDEGIALDTTQFRLQIESCILDIEIWMTRLRPLLCDAMGNDTGAMEASLRFFREGLIHMHSALLAAMETVARAWIGRPGGDGLMRRVNTVREALNTLPGPLER